ncbi:cytochrome C [Paracoccaceae bacterium Fryx2]|nr:cytochrome C [Paracoccaceae bacterium Fryx2]
MRILIPIAGLALSGVLAACVMPGFEKTPTGAEDFAVFCSACHGSGGRGNGEMAATLDRRPTDLTRLAAGNGGVFPMARVMSKVYGYAGESGPKDALMPPFGDLLEGKMVLYDSGDGIETPTPLRLVQLAEYVRGLPG